jgi:NAD(P)-dependent dehydrogenase (short-subunit alcohol dehydrogenase family)
METHLERPSTWLITGASRGFGRELTRQLLERGDRVAATARNPGALDDLASEHGERLWRDALDVCDTPALRRVVAEAFADLGRIEVVVSNAGYGLFGAAEEATGEQVRRQIDTNLVAPIELIRAVAPYLRAQGGGRIVQLSSSGGQVADPGMSLYNAGKFGIEGFCESAAMELAPFGIELTLVEPGGSRTGFRAGLDLAPPLAVYAEGVVGQVRRMLVEGIDPEVERRHVTGDPAKIAEAIIALADAAPAPLRLALGSVGYEQMAAGLRARLAALEAQRDAAYAADADDVAA